MKITVKKYEITRVTCGGDWPTTKDCAIGDLITVDEGVQCSNCGKLVIKNHVYQK